MKKTLITTLVGLLAVSSVQAYELKVLHINDHHSHLDADSGMDLTLAGAKTRVKAGGMARVATLFNELGNSGNVLKLHAGDAITGTLYYTTTKGEADAAAMNKICFDAFAVGNHEFDAGDAGLVDFINFLNPTNHPCASPTPILGANVVPEVGVSPLTPSATDRSQDYLKPYVIKTVGGEKIGIIGIVIANKTKNSSNPDASTQFLNEIETAQKYIDELAEKNIGKIIVLSHYQYANEINLAKALSGVDIVVGGDSHTLLGDGYAELGLKPGGAYPTVVTNKDGDTACVVQAWQYSAIVGELNVTFNGDTVSTCSGMPHMPLANSFKRKNSEGDRVELDGADREAVIQAVADNALLSIVDEDEPTKTVVAQYADEVDRLKKQKIATAAEDLCLERIPGQGYRNCDTTAMPLRGSEVSGVVSYAFLRQSNRADMTIQNAGGVRQSISSGDYTTGMAYELLPFSNTLVNIDMTGQQIKNVLEEALDYAYAGSTGAYPYGAGVRWSVNGAKSMGYRFSNIEVQDKNNSSWSPLQLDKIYTVVTNSYIASGKDGYLTFGEVSKDNQKIEDTYLDYAQSFVDYVTEKKSFGKLPSTDYSTQNYDMVYRSGNGLTGVWWDSSKSGQGVSFKESLSGESIGGALYTYQADKSPMWYIFNGSWVNSDAANAVSQAMGAIYRCTGSPAGKTWDSSLLQCDAAGTFDLAVSGDETLNFTYTVTGAVKQVFNLTPFTGVKANRKMYDNWYWDSAKNGQGIYLASTAMTQAQNIYPGIWYRYDAKGNATWYYLHGTRATADSKVINYKILRFTAGNSTGIAVGTASFTPASHNPGAGELKYTLDGEKNSLKLTGFDF